MFYVSDKTFSWASRVSCIDRDDYCRAIGHAVFLEASDDPYDELEDIFRDFSREAATCPL